MALIGSAGAMRGATQRGFAISAMVISIAEAAALAVLAGMAIMGTW